MAMVIGEVAVGGEGEVKQEGKGECVGVEVEEKGLSRKKLFAVKHFFYFLFYFIFLFFLAQENWSAISSYFLLSDELVMPMHACFNSCRLHWSSSLTHSKLFLDADSP